MTHGAEKRQSQRFTFKVTDPDGTETNPRMGGQPQHQPGEPPHSPQASDSTSPLVKSALPSPASALPNNVHEATLLGPSLPPSPVGSAVPPSLETAPFSNIKQLDPSPLPSENMLPASAVSDSLAPSALPVSAHIYNRCLDKGNGAIIRELLVNAADKHENLRAMLEKLGDYTKILPGENNENNLFCRALKSYVRILNKKVNPQNWRERFFYKRIPDNEIIDVTMVTFGLRVRAALAHNPGADIIERQKVEPASLNIQTGALAKQMTQYNWARIAGGLALIVLGAGLIVGAGCMIAATYGAASPVALTVAKCGFEVTMTAAVYLLAELALVPAYRKYRAGNKAFDSSTKKIAAGVLGGGMAAGLGTTGSSAWAEVLPGQVSVNSMIPGVSQTATTGYGITTAIAGMTTTAMAGMAAILRGTLFWHDVSVRKDLHQAVEVVLKTDPLTMANAPGRNSY